MKARAITTICVLTGFSLLMVVQRYRTEIDSHKQDFIETNAARARTVADLVSGNFRYAHQSLRTIARLPGVRALPDHQWTLTPDANAAITELYANLRTNVEISELYIIPQGFDPSLSEPKVGQFNLPVHQFDDAIAGLVAGGKVTHAQAGEVEEDESFEYAYMYQQLARFERQFPIDEQVRLKFYPGAISPPMITCDNSHLDPRSPEDERRSGMVLSVPFFSEQGRFAGMICAVIRTDVVRSMLPDADFALVQRDSGIILSRPGAGEANTHRDQVSRLSYPSDRIYAETIALPMPDSGRTWVLWATKPNAEFWDEAETHHTQLAAGAVALVLLCAGAGGIALVLHITNRGQRLRDRAMELERVVADRTSKLEETARQAQAATRAKSAFLANMSHEIRTPMTAIMGFSDMLLDPALAPQDRADHVQTIRRNADHLLTIINDILDVSKIEAGKMTLEQLTFSPCDLAEEVRSLLNPRAREKNLVIKVEHRFPLPRVIESDPTRLRQVLVNLVGNAIKFTSSGSVTISLSLGEAPASMRFEVTDTGIGMSPAQLTGIFQAFAQADESTTRRFGGTGLGLSLSRSLTHLMGGTLEARSELHQGSTFAVTIPIRVHPPELIHTITPAHAPPAPAITPAPVAQAAPRPLEGIRILLAEDGPDNQRLLRTILTKAGADVTIAANGRLAVQEALQGLESPHPFDLILMDMQMPVLDGYGATSLLRGQGYLGAIVALTAHAMSSERNRCAAAGCDDYATKPIQRAALIELCRTWARQRRAKTDKNLAQS